MFSISTKGQVHIDKDMDVLIKQVNNNKRIGKKTLSILTLTISPERHCNV